MVEIVPNDRLAGSPAWERLIDAVRDQARDDAANAVAWWQQDTIGGRVTGDPVPGARRVIDGIEDGDPEITDGLPSADLSGEMADGPTVRGLYEDHETDDLPEWDELPEWAGPEIGDAYETIFSETAESDIVAACRAVLPG